MLSQEWQELEELCERTATMRTRLEAAQKSRNAGLLESLQKDMEAAKRQREQLIQHISAHIGSLAA